MSSQPDSQSRKYAAIKGFFLQDDDSTDPNDLDIAEQNFGLKPLSKGGSFSDDWAALASRIESLNEHGKATGRSYKVFYVGRHGQGEHNVAESKYGTQAWEDHWSKLSGDGVLSWSDPHLTPTGIQQARRMHTFWVTQLSQGMPAPDTFHSSPLYRCLATCSITFSGLSLDASAPFRPVVRELLRETMGVHTCDRRSSASEMRRAWPGFVWEEGFAEEDGLWDGERRETGEELEERVRGLLDLVWKDGGGWVSLTTHTGWIEALMRVLGHREFKLRPGGAVGVVVEKSEGEGGEI